MWHGIKVVIRQPLHSRFASNLLAAKKNWYDASQNRPTMSTVPPLWNKNTNNTLVKILSLQSLPQHHPQVEAWTHSAETGQDPFLYLSIGLLLYFYILEFWLYAIVHLVSPTENIMLCKCLSNQYLRFHVPWDIKTVSKATCVPTMKCMIFINSQVISLLTIMISLLSVKFYSV